MRRMVMAACALFLAAKAKRGYKKETEQADKKADAAKNRVAAVARQLQAVALGLPRLSWLFGRVNATAALEATALQR
jgi:hypothetical protein